MSPERLRSFRADEAPPPGGAPTSGMDRHQLAEQNGTWIGWVRMVPGFAGGWHHHGDRDSYIYMIDGEMVLEFGSGGSEALTARPGDVVVVPRQAVHREITPEGRDATALVVRIGSGQQNYNVDGPEA